GVIFDDAFLGAEPVAVGQHVHAGGDGDADAFGAVDVGDDAPPQAVGVLDERRELGHRVLGAEAVRLRVGAAAGRHHLDEIDAAPQSPTVVIPAASARCATWAA